MNELEIGQPIEVNPARLNRFIISDTLRGRLSGRVIWVDRDNPLGRRYLVHNPGWGGIEGTCLDREGKCLDIIPTRTCFWFDRNALFPIPDGRTTGLAPDGAGN